MFSEGEYVPRRSRDVKTNYRSPGARRLHDVLGVEIGGPYGRRYGEPGHSTDDYTKFKDLVQRMLDYNPVKRITAQEAVKHPFLHKAIGEDFSRFMRSQIQFNNGNQLSFSDNTNNTDELSNIQRRAEGDDSNIPNYQVEQQQLPTNHLQPIAYFNTDMTQNNYTSGHQPVVRVQQSQYVHPQFTTDHLVRKSFHLCCNKLL